MAIRTKIIDNQCAHAFQTVNKRVKITSIIRVNSIRLRLKYLIGPFGGKFPDLPAPVSVPIRIFFLAIFPWSTNDRGRHTETCSAIYTAERDRRGDGRVFAESARMTATS